MILEIRINEHIQLQLQTKTIPLHSLLSDNPELIEKLKSAIVEVLGEYVVRPNSEDS